MVRKYVRTEAWYKTRSGEDGKFIKPSDFKDNTIRYCTICKNTLHGQQKKCCSSKCSKVYNSKKIKERIKNGFKPRLIGEGIDQHLKEMIRNSKTYKKNNCKRGKDNHLWAGGKDKEKYPVSWTENYKKIIRKRDNYTCQLCGNIHNGKQLDVHHINYNKKNINPNNLISLCMGCHRKTSFNRGKWFVKFVKIQMINNQKLSSFKPIDDEIKEPLEMLEKMKKAEI